MEQINNNRTIKYFFLNIITTFIKFLKIQQRIVYYVILLCHTYSHILKILQQIPRKIIFLHCRYITVAYSCITKATLYLKYLEYFGGQSGNLGCDKIKYRLIIRIPEVFILIIIYEYLLLIASLHY